MTITTPRPPAAHEEAAQLLFKEARQRRRRRYWYSAVVLGLIVCLGFALNQWFGGTPKRLSKSHSRAAASRAAPGPTTPTVVPRQPGPLALGTNGDLYVADDALNEILDRLPDGSFKVVAGTGKAGFSGDGGPATRAELNHPLGMAVAANGTLYFADGGNGRVRAILPNGIITTVAGNGLAATGPAGTPVITGSPVTTAIGPTDAVALGPGGSLYIATSFAVLELSPNDVLSDVVDPENDAGFDPSEPLNSQCDPASVAVDGSGDLYVGCSDPFVLVERLSSGALQSLGTDRPHDAAAALQVSPGGDVLAVDGFGTDPPGRDSSPIFFPTAYRTGRTSNRKASP
jgi:hypothetical protein